MTEPDVRTDRQPPTGGGDAGHAHDPDEVLDTGLAELAVSIRQVVRL